jgi:hypothetical protein
MGVQRAGETGVEAVEGPDGADRFFHRPEMRPIS